MEDELIVKISNGKATFIYSDELVELLKEGKSNIKRVSHVEPVGTNWYATVKFDGIEEVLGPFETRQEALDAEIEYLKQEIFECPAK